MDNFDRVAKLRAEGGRKLVIAGSRHFDEEMVAALILKQWEGVVKALGTPTRILSGGAKGVDAVAEKLAKQLTGKKAIVFQAAWSKYGKQAGPIRNTLLAQEGDAALIVWDGKSRGSADMLRTMYAFKKPVFEIEVG